MPLIEPVELLPIGELGSVHFIAIGGAGMSGIAAAYADANVCVSGSDQLSSPALEMLADKGIQVFVGHDPAHLGKAQTVVISSAIRSDNVELVAAEQRGLRIWHRSAALGALMLGKYGIAVSGTHGKTTTSAMISVMLSKLGAGPSFVLGAPMAGGSSSALGSGDTFVVEADESDGSFRQYPAQLAVITNIEADHLDNWGTPAAYAAGFFEFASAPQLSEVVLSDTDPGTKALIDPLLQVGKRVLGYSVNPEAIVITDHVSQRQQEFEWPKLLVPGEHNIRNAAAALAVGLIRGYRPDAVIAALESFGGTSRRFETVAKVNDVWIVDDYAHHPTEVRATLEAARSVTEGRVIACFQPHLFSRTRDFAEEFGRGLALADVVVVTDIYPAREDPIPGITGELVADAAQDWGAVVTYVKERENIPAMLAELVRPGDLVLTLGAGNVTETGPALAALLAGDHA